MEWKKIETKQTCSNIFRVKRKYNRGTRTGLERRIIERIRENSLNYNSRIKKKYLKYWNIKLRESSENKKSK